MITRVDPPGFKDASTVQVDSNAVDAWAAIEEVENWAQANGFVRTGEYHLRPVLVNGGRQFRAICYRISPEERETMELAQSRMTERGEALRGLVPALTRVH